MIVQPSASTAPPVQPAQVLVTEPGRGLWKGRVREKKLLEMGVWWEGMEAEGYLGGGGVFCQNPFSYSIPLQVSNISSQNPGTANQAPVICTQSSNVSNQVPEVDTQDPVASNQGSFSAEEDRQKLMDAAEALLILHNSPQACQETGSTPGTYLAP